MTEVPFQKGEKKGKILFQKGQPGGPGRPKGCRNKADLLLEAIGPEKIQRAYDKMAEIAEFGDKDGAYNACKWILERACPDEGRKIFLGKRSTSNPEMISQTAEKVVSMMFESEISIEECMDVCKILDQKMTTLFDSDVAKKIDETCRRANEAME